MTVIQQRVGRKAALRESMPRQLRRMASPPVALMPERATSPAGEPLIFSRSMPMMKPSERYETGVMARPLRFEWCANTLLKW